MLRAAVLVALLVDSAEALPPRCEYGQWNECPPPEACEKSCANPDPGPCVAVKKCATPRCTCPEGQFVEKYQRGQVWSKRFVEVCSQAYRRLSQAEEGDEGDDRTGDDGGDDDDSTDEGGIKDAPPPPPKCDPDAPFCVYSNCQFTGASTISAAQNIPSIETCEGNCVKDSRCQGYYYIWGPRQCVLFTGLASANECVQTEQTFYMKPCLGSDFRCQPSGATDAVKDAVEDAVKDRDRGGDDDGDSSTVDEDSKDASRDVKDGQDTMKSPGQLNGQAQLSSFDGQLNHGAGHTIGTAAGAQAPRSGAPSGGTMRARSRGRSTVGARRPGAPSYGYCTSVRMRHGVVGSLDLSPPP